MRDFIIVIGCLACISGVVESASQNPDASKQKLVHKFESNKNVHDVVKDMDEIDMGFMGGHGHTGQKSMDECPTICTYDLNPVCGSDGHTYNNKCLLTLEACRLRKRIYVEKGGRC